MSTHEVHFDCKYQKLDFRKKRKVNSQWFKSCCQTCVHAQSLQSCPTLCYPMDCSPPGSSLHGISQGRIMKWVVMPSSRRSTQDREQTYISCIAGRFFTTDHQGSPILDSATHIPPRPPIASLLELWFKLIRICLNILYVSCPVGHHRTIQL